jgi:hypothetical protein
MVLTLCDLVKLLLGYDIAMIFRGEKVHGFSFTPAVVKQVPAKPFQIGLGPSHFYARAVVNGIATLPEKRDPEFRSGIRFNPYTHVLEL